MLDLRSWPDSQCWTCLTSSWIWGDIKQKSHRLWSEACPGPFLLAFLLPSCICFISELSFRVVPREMTIDICHYGQAWWFHLREVKGLFLLFVRLNQWFNWRRGEEDWDLQASLHQVWQWGKIQIYIAHLLVASRPLCTRYCKEVAYHAFLKYIPQFPSTPVSHCSTLFFWSIHWFVEVTCLLFSEPQCEWRKPRDVMLTEPAGLGDC